MRNSMRNIWIIIKKELYRYFYSPLAYFAIVVLLFGSGFFFGGYLVQFAMYSAQTPIEHARLFEFFFSDLSIIFIFTIPLMTMHLFAEEQKSGTMELLMTKPIKDVEVVLGKYFAALLLFLTYLVITLFYVVLYKMVGANPDPGPIVSAYLGIFFVGAAFLAVGLFTSSVTNSHVAAGFLGWGILLFLWFVKSIGKFTGLLGTIFNSLALMDYFQDFGKGIIDAKNIVFYLSFITIVLFLTTRLVESRKWR